MVHLLQVRLPVDTMGSYIRRPLLENTCSSQHIWQENKIVLLNIICNIISINTCRKLKNSKIHTKITINKIYLSSRRKTECFPFLAVDSQPYSYLIN